VQVLRPRLFCHSGAKRRIPVPNLSRPPPRGCASGVELLPHGASQTSCLKCYAASLKMAGDPLEDYLRELRDIRRSGSAVPETSPSVISGGEVRRGFCDAREMPACLLFRVIPREGERPRLQNSATQFPRPFSGEGQGEGHLCGAIACCAAHARQ